MDQRRPPLVRLLELVASETPDQLGFALDMLAHSPARGQILALATRWGVGLEELGATGLRASSDLGRLERRRSNWRRPDQVCRYPNGAALLDLCLSRRDRTAAGSAQHQRLEIIGRKLDRALDHSFRRARIESVLGLNERGEDGDEPVDLAFLDALLGSRRTVRHQ